MRVVHFSDWHWGFDRLPEADLYVCTGDMYCNYPMQDRPRRPYDGGQYTINPRHERMRQDQAAEKLYKTIGGFRPYLRSPDAPIVCVRGNHDFIDLAPLFKGCNLVHEFVSNEVIELLGMKITGHRGVPTINGQWNDEVPRADLLDRVRAMPIADLYLTHYPPDDRAVDGVGLHYGLEGMLSNLIYRDHGGRRALHLFGHVHENGDTVVERGDVTLSNAATTWNMIDGSPEEGWSDVSPP